MMLLWNFSIPETSIRFVIPIAQTLNIILTVGRYFGRTRILLRSEKYWQNVIVQGVFAQPTKVSTVMTRRSPPRGRDLSTAAGWCSVHG